MIEVGTSTIKSCGQIHRLTAVEAMLLGHLGLIDLVGIVLEHLQQAQQSGGHLQLHCCGIHALSFATSEVQRLL